MICKKCGKEIPEDSEFCQFCGNKIEKEKIICPQCNEVLEDDSAYCTFCGAKIIENSELNNTDNYKEINEVYTKNLSVPQKRKIWIPMVIIVAALLAIFGTVIATRNISYTTTDNITTNEEVGKKKYVAFNMHIELPENAQITVREENYREYAFYNDENGTTVYISVYKPQYYNGTQSDILNDNSSVGYKRYCKDNFDAISFRNTNIQINDYISPLCYIDTYGNYNYDFIVDDKLYMVQAYDGGSTITQETKNIMKNILESMTID